MGPTAMSRPLRIGISPCPNDTFVFHGLMGSRVDTCGLDLSIELADVEELNGRFSRGELDAAKCSFHAALGFSRFAVVLPAGSALGFGVGPVLLARPGAGRLAQSSRVLCPGEGTTAHLLFRLFHPREGDIEQVLFSHILPRLVRGEADFGVCIHEARFTYSESGLALVEDLGETWERRTSLPLPLGGILARSDLGPDAQARLSRAIRGSLEYARAHREETLGTMRRHAQEMEERVLWKHVDLYVNEWTQDLGPEGRRALAKLHEIALAAGLAPHGTPPIEVFEPSSEALQSP
jgi:1,4-dihydroxy-6-naphthoate synthase